jgi:hypothetical protein
MTVGVPLDWQMHLNQEKISSLFYILFYSFKTDQPLRMNIKNIAYNMIL